MDGRLVEGLGFNLPVRPQVLLFTLGELLKTVNGSLTLGTFQAQEIPLYDFP